MWSRPSTGWLRRQAHPGGARLGVDRRIDNDSIDLEDVTRVRTAGDRIMAIGKGLAPYDCFDTGVFAIGPSLFMALRGLELPLLTEGMRVLAAEGTALTVDCGDLGWIDVDDEPALEKAESPCAECVRLCRYSEALGHLRLRVASSPRPDTFRVRRPLAFRATSNCGSLPGAALTLIG